MSELKSDINELINIFNQCKQENINLKNTLDKYKKDQSEYLNNKLRIKEMTDQINFYQEDNIRLSNEHVSIKKKYETIKSNFKIVEDEKKNIYNIIHDLNRSLVKNNIVGTPFIKKKITGDSINTAVLNNIADSNLEDEKNLSDLTKDLDKEINDIFK